MIELIKVEGNTIQCARVFDASGFPWMYNCYRDRQLDVDYLYLGEDREEGSGYYASSFEHALILLSNMDYI